MIPHHIPSNSLWIIIFSYQMYSRFSTQDSELCTFEELKGKKVQRAKLDLMEQWKNILSDVKILWRMRQVFSFSVVISLTH